MLHTCAVSSCGKSVCYGFGLPVHKAMWYCPEHREIGEARFSGTGAPVIEPPKPKPVKRTDDRQGTLL